MEVSINGGTSKSSIYRWIFHYKPSIFGDLPFMEPPIYYMLSGWWFQPLCKIWTSVGMIIPNWMENHKIHVPNHQPDIL